MSQLKANISELMVTIRCLVYNHEPYLRQCLDGFVMQKANFRFEAIVHDDASTDGSAAIIREYAEKYPDIIKPILETENQYSKKDGSLTRIMNAHTHGKYVALCEGDDYWTDPLKLQKQVDFLESHPDYSLCWHRCRFYSQNDGNYTVNYPKCGFESITATEFLNGTTIPQTLTLMYRRSSIDLNKYSSLRFNGDIVLYYMLLLQSKGHCMEDVMGVYRVHNQGVWSGANEEGRLLWDINAKSVIYNLNPSKEAAIYLCRMLDRNISRRYLVIHIRKLMPIYFIIYKHLGLLFLSKFLLNKYILRRKMIY